MFMCLTFQNILFISMFILEHIFSTSFYCLINKVSRDYTSKFFHFAYSLLNKLWWFSLVLVCSIKVDFVEMDMQSFS